jgi:hypothetical protein
LFARDGQVQLGRTVPDATWSDQALFAAPAAVSPLLDWVGSHPAPVVVVVDRAGGEVIGVGAGSARRHATTVAGPDDRPGDRVPKADRQPALQRRAVAARRTNATAVAAAVVRMAHDVCARLVVVAGDVHDVRRLRVELAAVGGDLDIRSVPGGGAAHDPCPTRRGGRARGRRMRRRADPEGAAWVAGRLGAGRSRD